MMMVMLVVVVVVSAASVVDGRGGGGCQSSGGYCLMLSRPSTGVEQTLILVSTTISIASVSLYNFERAQVLYHAVLIAACA